MYSSRPRRFWRWLALSRSCYLLHMRRRLRSGIPERSSGRLQVAATTSGAPALPRSLAGPTQEPSAWHAPWASKRLKRRSKCAGNGAPRSSRLGRRQSCQMTRIFWPRPTSRVTTLCCLAPALPQKRRHLQLRRDSTSLREHDKEDLSRESTA